jgi:hypothetical protein
MAGWPLRGSAVADPSTAFTRLTFLLPADVSIVRCRFKTTRSTNRWTLAFQ